MSQGYYRVGQYYVDVTTPSAPVLYRCITAGTNSTSVWAKVSSGSSGGTVQQFKVVSDGGDYLICHTWDGTTEGTLGVVVVKPYKLRKSIGSETIGGIAHTYTYSSDSYNRLVRNNAWSGASESELISPDYVCVNTGNATNQDIIYAVACAQTMDAANIPTAVAGVAIASGGSGYVSGDVGKVISLVGGTGTAATITIASVAGGAITGATLSPTAGLYTANPTLTGCTVTHATTTGSGATFNVTMAGQLLDLNVDGRAWAV